MFSILTRFELEGLFIWTLFRNQLEWENGVNKIDLGLVSEVKNSEGKVETWKLSPAALF